MPKRSRIDAAGALHHIIVTAIERSEGLRSDTDSKHFVERLAEVMEDTKANVKSKA